MDFVKFAKQKKKRSNKTPFKAVRAFIIGIVVVLLAFLVYFFISFPKGRTTFVLVGKSLTVVSLDNRDENLTIIPIPQNAYLTLTSGRGNLTASSLYKFDLLSKQKGQLFISTMREFLGIPIDGFINIKNDTQISNLDQFLNIQKKHLSFFSLDNLLTDSKKQHFCYKIGNIRKDKITVINLSSSDIFQEITMPDGSKVLEADEVKLDSLLQKQFFEKEILAENFSIAVYNSSKTAGLATRAARIIGNSGGNVIIVGENPNLTVNCVISVSPKDTKTYTVSRYQKLFNCEINNNMDREGRVEMTITLGTAYEKEIKGP